MIYYRQFLLDIIEARDSAALIDDPAYQGIDKAIVAARQQQLEEDSR